MAKKKGIAAWLNNHYTTLMLCETELCRLRTVILLSYRAIQNYLKPNSGIALESETVVFGSSSSRTVLPSSTKLRTLT